MEDTINVNKQALIDLMILKEKFNGIVESLEIMSNHEFMESYKKSKEQIEKRDFEDWDEL